VALDFDRLDEASRFADRVAGLAGMFKINAQLFTAAGPEAVRRIAGLGPGVFLDLKYHDIPNTVGGAVTAAALLPGVHLLNVHATGGLAMMRAAAHALAEAGLRGRRPKLLAVTVLTSLDRAALRQTGITGTPGARAVSLARLAKRAGLDGVVASPQEIRQIRRACGRKFLIVVPGVRPLGAGRAGRDDQARVATPGEAIRAGADYLVVGRPITAASDPEAAARAILEEIAAELVPRRSPPARAARAGRGR
jgi:orotidine-5'-phosphate decarboxylase